MKLSDRAVGVAGIITLVGLQILAASRGIDGAVSNLISLSVSAIATYFLVRRTSRASRPVHRD